MLPRRDRENFRLNRTMERMIDFMIEGDPLAEQREPLDPYNAGKASGYNRKAVRALLAEPAFIAAYEEKRRLFERDGYVTALQPTIEHIRDQMRWQGERSLLRARIKELETKLIATRREITAHYITCPKNPKPGAKYAENRRALEERGAARNAEG